MSERLPSSAERRRYTRRGTLATLGAASLAGCSSLPLGTDRPSFDESELEGITDAATPVPTASLPVTFADDQLASFEALVASLLEPIPDPVTPEIVSDAGARGNINRPREKARRAVGRMYDAGTVEGTATAAAQAASSAGYAAGIWAWEQDDRSVQDVDPWTENHQDRRWKLLDEIPGEADGLTEGAVVYGILSRWLEGNVRPLGWDLHDWDDPELRLDTVGGRIASRARSRVWLESASHVRERYLDSLADPRPIAADLSAAIDDLYVVLGDRIRTVFDGIDLGETDTGWFDATDILDRLKSPSIEYVVDRVPPEESPASRLLKDALRDVFVSDVRSPTGEYLLIFVGPDYRRNLPDGVEILELYRMLAELNAIDAVAGRVDDGDDMYPADAAAIEEARAGAIDAVSELAAAESPLSRWMASRLVAAFDEPDDRIDDDFDARAFDPTDAGLWAYADYRWIDALAEAIPDATELVEDELGG